MKISERERNLMKIAFTAGKEPGKGFDKWLKEIYKERTFYTTTSEALTNGIVRCCHEIFNEHISIILDRRLEESSIARHIMRCALYYDINKNLTLKDIAEIEKLAGKKEEVHYSSIINSTKWYEKIKTNLAKSKYLERTIEIFNEELEKVI